MEFNKENFYLLLGTVARGIILIKNEYKKLPDYNGIQVEVKEELKAVYVSFLNIDKVVFTDSITFDEVLNILKGV